MHVSTISPFWHGIGIFGPSMLVCHAGVCTKRTEHGKLHDTPLFLRLAYRFRYALQIWSIYWRIQSQDMVK
jgi:hypothetical protein